MPGYAPRNVEGFDLDAKDFLKTAPSFTLEDIAALEINPSAWALRAIQKRGGRRHPKRVVERPTFEAVPFTPASHGAYGYVPIGAIEKPRVQLARPSDTQALMDKFLEKARRKDRQRLSSQQPPGRKSVPPGNLPNDEYRYWKGWAIETAPADEGTCRWCQCHFKGREAMMAHQVNASCKGLLMDLYRYARTINKAQIYCFACKKVTRKLHWGLPLCDTVQCHSLWKFNWNDQLQGFMQYKTWALQAQHRLVDKGPFGDRLKTLANVPDPDDDITWPAGHC